MLWYSLEISAHNVKQMKSDRRNAQFVHGYRSNVLFTLRWDVCVDTHKHTSPALQNKWKRSYFSHKPRVVFTCGLSLKMTPFVAVFFPATMTLQSIHMSDTYFNTPEPMKRIGQPDRTELKQAFYFEGRIWDWWLSFWEMCDWAVEWGLELRVCWGTETIRYGVIV